MVKEWIQRQQEDLESRKDLMPVGQLRTDSWNLLSVLGETLSTGAGSDISRAEWAKARDLLGDLPRRRVSQGFSPSETATFVISQNSLCGTLRRFSNRLNGCTVLRSLELAMH